MLRVAMDGHSLQPGFCEDTTRGIGVYARELVRALAARQYVALSLWFEPALPMLNGLIPAGVLTRSDMLYVKPKLAKFLREAAVLAEFSGALHGTAES